MDTLVTEIPSDEEAYYAQAYGVKIGAGAFRKVYRIPGSRFAYKFEHARGWSSNSGANRQEFHNYTTRRATLPEGVDFPEMHMLPSGAIAVEFVDGVLGKVAHSWSDNGLSYRDNCMCSSHWGAQCWKKAIEGIDMRDLHGGNVMITRQGKILIIDIGEYGDDTL